jgi:hypothetical protein
LHLKYLRNYEVAGWIKAFNRFLGISELEVTDIYLEAEV